MRHVWTAGYLGDTYRWAGKEELHKECIEIHVVDAAGVCLCTSVAHE